MINTPFYKKDQTWQRFQPVLNTDELKDNLSDLKLSSKCINANVYLPIENLGEKIVYEFKNIDVSTDAINGLSILNVEKYLLPHIETYPTEITLEISEHSNFSMNDVFIINSVVKTININNNWDYYLTSASVPIFPPNLILETVNIKITINKDVYEESKWLGYKNAPNLSKEDYHHSLKGLFTADKAIQYDLKNFRIVDLATTENMLIGVVINNPLVDGFTVKIGHRVLFIRQDNPIENGVYVYTSDKKFVRSNELSIYSDVQKVSYHVKLGLQYREAQFFLQRKNTDTLYPIDGEEMYFELNHNYLLRNKLEYKNLYDIEFFDVSTYHSGSNRHYWTVGEYGIVIARNFITNQNEYFNVGTKEKLKSIFLAKDSFGNRTNNIWICGRRGTIINTKDNGDTWLLQDSKVEHDLNEIVFSDDQFGLTVGNNATILYTVNGGLFWKKINILESNLQVNFNSVKFYTNSKAVVVGDNGVVIFLEYLNNQWVYTQLPIFKILNILTSVKFNLDLNSVCVDNVNQLLYVVGEAGTIFEININTLQVFFYESLDPTDIVDFYDVIYSSPINTATFVGADNLIRILNSYTLLPGSNIRSMNDMLSNYNPVSFSNVPRRQRINALEINTFISNFPFIAGFKSIFGNITPAGKLKVYNSFYNGTEFNPKLLVLDYKIGDKMYFIDNNNELIIPKNLYNPLPVINGIPFLTNVGDTIQFTNPITEQNVLNYLDSYSPTIVNKTFTVYSVLAYADYFYGQFDIIDLGNTYFTFFNNKTELFLNDATFIAGVGDCLEIEIYDYTNTLLFLKDIFIVDQISVGPGITLTFKDVFDDTFKNDLYNAINPYKIKIKNLQAIKYDLNPNAILLNFLQIFQIHTLGNFYKCYEVPTNFLWIEGLNNSYTKYFNLKTDIIVNTGVPMTYTLDYNEDATFFKYGPRYNLLDIMNAIDPIVFTPTTSYNMPQTVFNYQSSPLINTQFVFNSNTIVMRSAYAIDYDAYYINTFVDFILNGITPIKYRVLLINKYIKIENGITRYYFVFNEDLQALAGIFGIITGNTITLKSRRTLSEISEDLRYANDKQIDLYYTNILNTVTNYTYGNELKTFNTDSYAKILMESIDVQEKTSGLIFTDKNFNLNFSALNIKNDPYLNFQPVDIHDIGIDKKPKNAVAISVFNSYYRTNYENLKYVLYLTFSGANNSNIFVDGTGKVITAISNPIISTNTYTSIPSSGLFNGLSDHLTTPYTPDFDLSLLGGFSLSISFNANSFTSPMVLLSKDDFGTGLLDYAVFVDNSTSITIYTADLTAFYNITVPTMLVGTWYKFKIVTDGLNLEIFFNDVSYGVGSMSFSNNTLTPITIGCRSYDAPNTFFDGYIDDIILINNSLPSYNPLINDLSLSLKNVDLKKYNFRLIDGLTILTLQQKYPWILEAEIQNALIGQDKDGLVWYKGDWLCGTWKGGKWYSGRFFEGIWVTGEWFSREIEDRIFSAVVKSNENENFSTWFDGIWISGVWYNGTWLNGEWQTGLWSNGLWFDGVWYDGKWLNGIWSGGQWIIGGWYDGKFNTDNTMSIWHNGFWYGGDFENGLWKEGEFNQLANKLSRFGTKSTPLQTSVWEHGVFVKGEIHTYLNQDSAGNTLPSIGYKYTKWKSGVFKNGTVYGATFEQGNFQNGIFYKGYVNGGLSLVPLSVTNPILNVYLLTFDVTSDLFFKLKPKDYIYIIGSENLSLPITTTMNALGLNTAPKKHQIYAVDTINSTITLKLTSTTPLILNEINGVLGGYNDLFSVFFVEDIKWYGGIFNNGLWLNGYWYGGMWVDGIWDDGIWMDPNALPVNI